MKTPLIIDQPKAVEMLLSEMYYSEFITEDGSSYHPKGLTFYEWLYKNKLISAENLEEIKAEIKREQQSNPEWY